MKNFKTRVEALCHVISTLDDEERKYILQYLRRTEKRRPKK